MIEIKGKYNEAKIFTDVVDSASVAQVQELCNQEFTAGSRIRLMPDIHAGAGCTVGTTMTISDRVVPNLVGVDIGCGMETVRIRESHLELQKLDKLIYEKIPSGFSIRTKAHRYLDQIELSELCCARHVDLLRAEKSIGTLGGEIILSRRIGMMKEICILLSIPEAVILAWRWRGIIRRKGIRF